MPPRPAPPRAQPPASPRTSFLRKSARKSDATRFDNAKTRPSTPSTPPFSTARPPRPSMPRPRSAPSPINTSTMKRLLLPLLGLAVATLAFAQQPPAETFVKGEATIRFNTRTSTDSDGKPREGVTDKYTLKVNVSNSVQLRGTVEATPYVSKLVGSSQKAKLDYLIECDVINPKNPDQTRNIGRMFGMVPVDEKNVYHYDEGNLKTVVFPVGTAKGFESVFK